MLLLLKSQIVMMLVLRVAPMLMLEVRTWSLVVWLRAQVLRVQ